MNLLESMKVYVVVVEAGSLSAAASLCGISATMAGKHLRMLEDRLGLRLLHRTTRRQQLTDFGHDYYARCKEVLRLVADADVRAQDVQHAPAGTLRISAPVTFGAEALMPVVSEYLQQHPKVSVDVVLSDEVVDLVADGFDLAIRIGRLPDSTLLARPLAPYRLMMCASPEYLRRHGVPQRPEDLSRHECLAFGPADLSHWRMKEGAVDYRVPVSGRLKASHGPALRAAAIQGLGIVLQPAILLEPAVRAGALAQVLPAFELPSRDMNIVYLRDRHRSPKLRTFIEFVAARFERAATAAH